MKKLLIAFSLLSLLLCTACGEQTPAASQPETPQTQTEEPETPETPETEVVPDLEKEPDPWSKEFSVLVDGQQLKLGRQTGAFPWDTSLEKRSVEYETEGQYDTFEIECVGETELSGLRAQGQETEADGLLTEIDTEDSAIKTYRGAYVGMSMEDVLTLYPEADQRDDDTYVFYKERSTVSKIEFEFENGLLESISIESTAKE